MDIPVPPVVETGQPSECATRSGGEEAGVGAVLSRRSVTGFTVLSAA